MQKARKDAKDAKRSAQIIAGFGVFGIVIAATTIIFTLYAFFNDNMAMNRSYIDKVEKNIVSINDALLEKENIFNSKNSALESQLNDFINKQNKIIFELKNKISKLEINNKKNITLSKETNDAKSH